VQDDGAPTEELCQGPAETFYEAHACSLLLGGALTSSPDTEIPLGARLPIANVCMLASANWYRKGATPIASHFLGCCGKNVALLQYN
jgi:hypothetical protein